MMFRAFAKKLFGAGYERLKRTLLVYLIVFWGLHISGVKVEMAPFVLYLMAGSFTASVMWQALSSGENAENMKNLFMLPFESRDFVLSYVAALGAHTLLTKTGELLAVVFALTEQGTAGICGSIFCAVSAALMAAVVFSMGKYRYRGCLWAAVLAAAVLFLCNTPWVLPVMAVNGICAFLVLWNADGYSFYIPDKQSGHIDRRGGAAGNGVAIEGKGRFRKGGRASASLVWRYFFRYMKAHKNYLANTVIMWGIACALPVFLGNMESLFVMPVGFALVSFNTPVCILLSADPALERAVRFLPGQMRGFCMPYCLFIFMWNSIAEVFFLGSWQLQIGGVNSLTVIIAFSFALLSAFLSVLLEWIYPVRGWKLESDLWHHPRKYLVPLVMLLLAGAVGTIGDWFL